MTTPARQPRNCRVSSACDWADELLGFHTAAQPLLPQQSVEAEVEAYLLDSQVGTSSVSFWQVSPSVTRFYH